MPDKRPLVLGCTTCRVHRTLHVDDLSFRELAREFFIAHGDCETYIDLDGPTLRNWRLRTR
jgi:hypothetical protein